MFRDWALHHLFLAGVITLLYLVSTALISLATEVGRRLRKRWAEAISNWLNLRVEWVISRPHARYSQFMQHQHESFDMQGLTPGEFNLYLEEVFVPLDVIPRAPYRVSSDPIPETTQQEGYLPIWAYLGMAKQRHFALLGAPGTGKTTLLKYMSLVLVKGWKARRRVHAPPRLPILLFLRDHAETIKANPDLSLEELVHAYVNRRRPQGIAPHWFAHQLQQGRCLVMLDGLDEIADATSRELVVGWVEQQMKMYAENYFLVTSRPSSYQGNPVGGVTTLEVRPFTRAQVRQFVHNWYLADETRRSQKDTAEVRDWAAEGADELLKRVQHSPALSRLAVNPLLLTMIATIHRNRSSLPDHRVQLYKEICEVFLGKRQDAKGLTLDLTAEQQELVLQTLAFEMMCTEVQEISFAAAVGAIREPLKRVKPQAVPEDFLRAVENNSTSLLVEREPGVYGFAHVNFQNYLAARHISEQKMEGALVGRVKESWWHETISLYCAQADATPIIAACLDEEPPSAEALLLAIECDEEARDVQPDIRAQLKSLLEEGIEDPDFERQAFVADILLTRRLRQMALVGDETYVDNALITCGEYQVFLDEQYADRRHYLPDHWQSERFSPGQGKLPVLGVRPSDATAFCDWLTRREAGDWRYRLPEVDEVDGATHQALSATGGYWMMNPDQGAAGYQFRGACVSCLTPMLLKECIEADFSTALDLALKRNPDLASELRLSQAPARHRPHARSQMRELTQTQEKQWAQAQARDLDLVLGLIRDLALDRHLNSTRTLTLARELARAHDRDRDRVRSLTLETTQARARTLFRMLNAELPRALVIDHDQMMARRLVRMIDTARLRGLVQALERALDLERLPITGTPQEARDTMELLRWFIRFTVLLLIEAILGMTGHPSGERGRRGIFQQRGNKGTNSSLEEAISACREIYLDFAMLLTSA